MPTIKGQAPCPECGSTQDVKHDGRKFYIPCTECRTMTSYQSKAAKERIEKKLVPVDPVPETPETIEKEKPKEPPKKPRMAKPANATTGSFFDSLNELF